jgi:hypothetical protein
MNILELKRKLLPMSGPQMDGGGGGGSGTGTQTNISELPEWARGYAKDTLEKGAALSETPYQKYDQNRIAGFSPMQLQSQQGAANMQTNAGTSAGMGIAGAAALGGLNQDYQGGQFSGGRFGNRQAAQYMSPYIEQAMEPQLREAARASSIQGQQNAAGAVGKGAFGGSRSGLVEAERQRNLATQQGDIRAKGLQTAYEQAANQFNQDSTRGLQAQQAGEQSRQFGANLGLQGLNTALQGASQLGTLGQQQFQQGMDINKLQNAYGGQEQALRQQGLTQAYQDFQNEQNYPYKQLGFFSDLIRGMPVGQATTKTMYEPDPSMAQQAGSLAMGAYGLSKFMAEGGMAYADGGSVDSADNVQRIVSKLSDQQLQQAAKAAQARGDADQLEAIQSEMGMRASERNGLASAVSPQMADRMAGGGVVAFAEGGVNDALARMRGLAETDLTMTPEQRMAGISEALPQIQAMYGPSATAPYLEEVKKERAALSGMNKEGEGLAFLAGAEALLRPGSKSRAVTGALSAVGGGLAKAKKEQREADRLLRQSEMTLATAEQARKDGQIGKAESLFDKAQDLKEKGLTRQLSAAEKEASVLGGIKQSEIGAAATLGKPSFDMSMVKAKIDAALEANPEIAKDPKALADLKAKAYSETAQEVKSVYASGQRTEATAREKAAAAVDTGKLTDPVWKEAKKNKDSEGMRAREEELINMRMKKPEGSGPAPAQPAPSVAKGPDLNTFMVAARKANPGVPDADLKAYYNSTYK